MSGTRRGRVRAGIVGFHPGLQQTLIPGAEHDVPVTDWSDDLFEAVQPAEVVEAPVVPAVDEVRPLRGRQAFLNAAAKEG